jgi:hypothetical protein
MQLFTSISDSLLRRVAVFFVTVRLTGNRHFLFTAKSQAGHMEKRGRPKKELFDVMRTKAWYLAVQLRLQVSTAHAVEVRVESDNKAKRAAKFAGARRWAGYRDGTRVPQDIHGLLNPIDMAEKIAVGSARWFRSPMWNALKGQFAHHDDVTDALSDIKSVASVVFSDGNWVSLDEQDLRDFDIEGSQPLAASRTIVADSIAGCANLDGIDLLETVILLLEHGRLSASLTITRRALDLYAAASRKIAVIPEVGAVLPGIFEVIEARYAPNLVAPPEEIFSPWHVRMPDLVEKIWDVAAMRAEALVATDAVA